MASTKNFSTLFLFLFLQFCTTKIIVHAKIHVRVVNRLGDGQSLALHCQSRDDDLGNVVLENDKETEWSFKVNFLGSTLFHCDVKWGRLNTWYSFDAYDANRDYARCRSECRWMISNDGSLYGYDEQYERWVLFPLRMKI